MLFVTFFKILPLTSNFFFSCVLFLTYPKFSQGKKVNMKLLIDKELNSNDKILKPDFNSRTGRELLVFYLQTKFRQIMSYDRKCSTPLFREIHPEFINRFSKRLRESLRMNSGKVVIQQKLTPIRPIWQVV